MVRVIDVALAGPAPRGIGSNDDIGLGPADPAGDLAAKVERRLQGPVVIPEEEHVLDPQLHSSGALLRVADLGEPLGRHCRVAAAAVAVGEDQVGDLPAFRGPPCDRPRGAELRVIRVGHDDQDANLTVRRLLHQAGVGIEVETS